VDGNGAVDAADLAVVNNNLGCPVGTGDPVCDACDVDCDGDVDPFDFIVAACQRNSWPPDRSCCPPVCRCWGDVNGDGHVDLIDSAAVKAYLGCPVGAGDPACDACDVDCDQDVDENDVSIAICQTGSWPPDTTCCAESFIRPAPQHPWGWKTRQPQWNDAAVVTTDPTAPLPRLEPDPGSVYLEGYPIDTWDMAFVLTTPAWSSVRTHTNGGALPIYLDPAAIGEGVISETRRYGIQQIQVDFSEPVQIVAGAVLQAIDVNDGTPYPVTAWSLANGDHTLVMNWIYPGDPATGLPDERCYRIDLQGCIANLAGIPLGGDTDCMVRGLVGDTNNDEKTNLIDMAQTKSRNGKPLFGSDIRFDVNLDGSINLIDMALVKSLNGNSASCP
jgi:hypothetical protein